MVKPLFEKVISGATGTTKSVWIDTMGHNYICIIMKGTGATVEATIKLEGSPTRTDADAYDILTSSFTTSAILYNYTANYHPFVRANITSYTNGTFDVWIGATGFEGTF